MAAHAAEPSEAAALASASCTVVVPSNELSLFPYDTAVEPPEVAATAAEPPEVSVVSTYQLFASHVTGMEAICEPSACPVTAMEAIYELSVCPITFKGTVAELRICPVKENVNELYCLVLNRPWRPIMSYCPVLTQPRRLPMNTQSCLLRLQRP